MRLAETNSCFCDSLLTDLICTTCRDRGYKIHFQEISMNLRAAEEGKEYIIKQIETDDEELNSFLFSLGCYSGEPITVISHLKGGCVVSIKDGRYNIDKDLAEAIII